MIGLAWGRVEGERVARTAPAGLDEIPGGVQFGAADRVMKGVEGLTVPIVQLGPWGERVEGLTAIDRAARRVVKVSRSSPRWIVLPAPGVNVWRLATASTLGLACRRAARALG